MVVSKETFGKNIKEFLNNLKKKIMKELLKNFRKFSRSIVKLIPTGIAEKKSKYVVAEFSQKKK